MVPGDATVVKKEKRYQGLKRKISCWWGLKKVILVDVGALGTVTGKIKKWLCRIGTVS